MKNRFAMSRVAEMRYYGAAFRMRNGRAIRATPDEAESSLNFEYEEM